jgi:hypothetical protein
VRLTAQILIWRSVRLKRWAETDRRSALERQLADCGPAGRRDLLATLDRYPDPLTSELRSILDRQERAHPLTGGWTMRP